MIKGHVARAMQVSCLSKDQLKKLQERENERKYLIANWNIQQLFKIQSIKDICNIPFDDEAQARHQARIEKDLYQAKLFITGEQYDTDLEWVHAFDWNIFNNRNKINWDYSSGGARKGLKRRLDDAGDAQEQAPF